MPILGKPLDHENQIEYDLKGISEDYKPMIEQIENKDTHPSFLTLSLIVTTTTSLRVTETTPTTELDQEIFLMFS